MIETNYVWTQNLYYGPTNLMMDLEKKYMSNVQKIYM